MSPRMVRVAGLLCSTLYAGAIVWVYARQPETMRQMAGGIASTFGAYHIDETSFRDGLRFFRNEQFAEARAAFARADPAQQDPRTQFYIAYTFYREGWGRVYHDDALYRQGVAAINRAIAIAADRRILVNDPALGLQSSDELKAELERGLARDASDFNPMKVFRSRK